jgi:hypothetical protein
MAKLTQGQGRICVREGDRDWGRQGYNCFGNKQRNFGRGRSKIVRTQPTTTKQKQTTETQAKKRQKVHNASKIADKNTAQRQKQFSSNNNKKQNKNRHHNFANTRRKQKYNNINNTRPRPQTFINAIAKT